MYGRSCDAKGQQVRPGVGSCLGPQNFHECRALLDLSASSAVGSRGGPEPTRVPGGPGR